MIFWVIVEFVKPNPVLSGNCLQDLQDQKEVLKLEEKVTYHDGLLHKLLFFSVARTRKKVHFVPAGACSWQSHSVSKHTFKVAFSGLRKNCRLLQENSHQREGNYFSQPAGEEQRHFWKLMLPAYPVLARSQTEPWGFAPFWWMTAVFLQWKVEAISLTRYSKDFPFLFSITSLFPGFSQTSGKCPLTFWQSKSGKVQKSISWHYLIISFPLLTAGKGTQPCQS